VLFRLASACLTKNRRCAPSFSPRSVPCGPARVGDQRLVLVQLSESPLRDG